MKKVILSVFGVLLVLWVTGIILENFFDVDLDKYFGGSPSTAQASAPVESAPGAARASSAWTTYKNDDFHFSIDSPFELKEIRPPGATTKNFIAQGQDMATKFTVNVTGTEMAQNPDIDWNKAMDQQIRMFKLMDKLMSNFRMDSNPITLSGAPGVLGTGTYQMFGKDGEMKILKTKTGAGLVDVLVQYPPSEENRALADKVIHSLSISN